MKQGTRDAALAALERFLADGGHGRRAPETLRANGRVAGVLATSKPGGVLLNLVAPELSFFLADGMDITSQLVNVVTEPEVHDRLKRSFSEDIRVSVHAQHVIEFLTDIRDHRFDLVTFGGIDPAAAELAAASLAPGGLFAAFPQGESAREFLTALDAQLRARGLSVALDSQGRLLAARGPEQTPARRRGGRRRRPRPQA